MEIENLLVGYAKYLGIIGSFFITICLIHCIVKIILIEEKSIEKIGVILLLLMAMSLSSLILIISVFYI